MRSASLRIGTEPPETLVPNNLALSINRLPACPRAPLPQILGPLGREGRLIHPPLLLPLAEKGPIGDNIDMPLFDYRGLTKDGKNVRGSLDADNVRAARVRLKKDGIFIIDLKNKAKESERRKAKGRQSAPQSKVNVQDLSMMTRQLATLIKSNIPLVEALAAVADQVENPTLKDAMSEIKNAVNEGGQFHRSLSKYPKIFDKIYISMVEAGETSGTLDVILLRLAEFTESQNELNKKIQSALMYPILMLVITMAVLMLLFVYVIPKVTTIFDQMDMKLPWIGSGHYNGSVLQIGDTTAATGSSAGLLCRKMSVS